VTSAWTEADFEALAWHDVHVHGVRIIEGEHGAGELCLDLDYIVDWLCPVGGEGRCRFRIAPALLTFREVTGLKLSLDYATPSAAMGPFSIHDVRREEFAYPRGACFVPLDNPHQLADRSDLVRVPRLPAAIDGPGGGDRRPVVAGRGTPSGAR
jgi:hypothetical protein